jgi:hydrogenase maturation protein HypF
MAEFKLSEPVIGISYDGVGFGTDGHIWGSEVMVADFKTFRRISHFEYIPLPGGDLATKQPWRTALSYLHHTFGKDFRNIDIPFLSSLDLNKADKIIEAIEHKINSPLCCSTGRLFDAVSALLNICTISNYHAEAPLRLENYLTENVNEIYPFSGSNTISMKEMIREIVKDIQTKKSLEYIVTRFHNTIAQIALHQVRLANKESGIKKIVLSGGSFQNKYLTEKLVTLLLKDHFEVYYPQEIPCNDGGLALGQLTIAANKED